MKILVLNGPNLNMLGIREPDIYGASTYDDLISMIAAHCEEKGIEVKCLQSNHEGDLVDYIQQAYFDKFDGIVINPGAYTHTSVALLDALKATRRTIVFTEGTDARILEAADRLIKDDLMDVILIGAPDEVAGAARNGGFNVDKATVIDPLTYADMENMVQTMVELRKGKMTEEQCRDLLKKGNYFGTMLVKMGKADALLGGATYSTADTVRPALQLVKDGKRRGEVLHGRLRHQPQL